MSSKTIKLFWWSEINLMGKDKENYGDLIGKYLVEKISGKKVKFIHPNKNKWRHQFSTTPIYATAGSILAHVNKHCVVWGSGIIQHHQKVKPAKFLAVRGPLTYQNLNQQGYDVPEIFGDPALLLPQYFNPDVKKEYKLGLVPHYSDYKDMVQHYDQKNINIINLMTNSIEDTTKEFLKCDRIVSTSLHGLIIAHTYGIPAVWLKFSNKLFGDDTKFYDYFASVKLQNIKPITELDLSDKSAVDIAFSDYPSLPKEEPIKSCRENLLKVCPF